MNVVEHNNYWDGIMNGVDPGVEEFSNILNMLDFPMESLEGDSVNGDLDPSNLGPIPMDALTGVTLFPQGNIGNGAADMVPSYGAPADTKSWPKELLNCVDDETGTNALCQGFISAEPSTFQTRSPVSVLESSGSCSSDKSLSVIADRPVRARSKRARKPTVNPWLLISPIISSASLSNKDSNTGTGKEKTNRKRPRVPSALEAPENFHLKAKKRFLEQQRAKENKETSLQRFVGTKKCTHCEITKTPQWREGPLGPKTLCNACGVRYRSGRLFPEYRPAASPTFVPSLHSNSHKKVIAMRKKAMPQEPVAEVL